MMRWRTGVSWRSVAKGLNLQEVNILLDCPSGSCDHQVEHCYGALMASARTDPQRAEKRQSFGFEIR
jgi:hypothetical protein